MMILCFRTPHSTRNGTAVVDLLVPSDLIPPTHRMCTSAKRGRRGSMSRATWWIAPMLLPGYIMKLLRFHFRTVRGASRPVGSTSGWSWLVGHTLPWRCANLFNALTMWRKRRSINSPQRHQITNAYRYAIPPIQLLCRFRKICMKKILKKISGMFFSSFRADQNSSDISIGLPEIQLLPGDELAFDLEFRNQLIDADLPWASELDLSTLKYLLSSIQEYRVRCGGGDDVRAKGGLYALKKVVLGESCKNGLNNFDGIPTILDSELAIPTGAKPRDWDSWLNQSNISAEWLDPENNSKTVADIPEKSYSGWRIRHKNSVSEIEFDLQNGKVKNLSGNSSTLWSPVRQFVALFPNLDQKPLFNERFRTQLALYKYTNCFVYPDISRQELIDLFSHLSIYASSESFDIHALNALKRLCAHPFKTNPFVPEILRISSSRRTIPVAADWSTACPEFRWICGERVISPTELNTTDYEGWKLQRGNSNETKIEFKKVANYGSSIELELKCYSQNHCPPFHSIFQFIANLPNLDLRFQFEDCLGEVRIWATEWVEFTSDL